MYILMIDSARVNYVEPGEFSRGLEHQPYVLDVTSLPSNEQLARADGIIAFHSVVIDASLIAKMQRCRVLVKATIGLDDVDVVALSAKGILCSNIGSVGVEEVAEHAMALILLAQRKLLDYSAHTKRGGWSWRAHAGELKTCNNTILGLIGYGATGRALARRASAMGYQINYYDPYVAHSDEGVTKVVTLESLLDTADVISMHLPLTQETRHLMNDERFSHMKSGATLVNTARGGIVDTNALLRALHSGKMSMALLDVLQEEPQLPQAVIEHERIFLTPHSAFYSDRSLGQLKTHALDTLLRLLNGKRVETVVNPNCVWGEAKGYA